ncbi:MAG: hypothetical protein KY467_08835 [Gemmatimonadetes bacterium]|nr:hypothetical protein [Gemmatimonadota bacterium]
MRPLVCPLLAFALGCGEVRTPSPGPEPAAGAQAEPARRDGILLLAVSGDVGVEVDPVAILTPGGLLDPWSIPEDSTFNARYYRPGTRYALRVGGVPAGEVAVVEVLEPACSDRLAIASAALTRTLPARWEGLASDAFGAAPAQPPLRPADASETAVLAALADSVHAARGAGPDRRRQAELTALHAVSWNGIASPVLVGTSNIAFQVENFEQVRSAMVVAERRDGAYRPVYVWYSNEREASMQRRALHDALDLDGDGVPELLAMTRYYESWDYTVLRRGAEGWTEIYHGGGGGC